MRRQAILVAMLVLAACSGEQAGDADIAAVPADVVPAALPPTPAALPPPAGPGEGRWRVSMTVQGTATTPSVSLPVQEDCLIDRISMRQAQLRQAERGISCSDYAFRQEGASTIGSFNCSTTDGKTFRSEVTTTGDMMRAYTSTIVNTASEASPGAGTTTTTLMLVAERIGECPSSPPPPLFPDPPETPVQ